MFWADELVHKIIHTEGLSAYWVDDMKTPSGRVHVGALRGVVIHGLIHQLLLENQKPSTYTYIFNDMDPMDGFPEYLPESFKEHMGKPLYRIPSPEPGYNSLAELCAEEFTQVFNSLGFIPKILRSSQMYQAGKFNPLVRDALDNREAIYRLYHDISGYNKPGNWYPYQVICPSCGRVGTTITTGWDGTNVSFTCQTDLVTWAKGCGYQGKIEPVGDNGKLMWKVDWAAHWKVVGITIEGAGKDHMTDKGSHDLSSAIAEKVFQYHTPYGFLYEWFLAKGGSKMSSSKGVGASAKDISQTLPPEILRFLLVRTTYKRAIIFDPFLNDSLLQLFDEYDQFAQAYYENQKTDEARAWQLSQIKPIPSSPSFLPRFRDVVNYIQNPAINIHQQFKIIKGTDLTEIETAELDQRIHYAKIWLEKYAPQKFNFQILKNTPVAIDHLTDKQIEFLKFTAAQLNLDWSNPDDLQQALYEHSKTIHLPAKDAFSAIYLALLGKTHGPKAAWLLLNNKDLCIQRLTNLKKHQPADQHKITSVTSAHIKLNLNFKQSYPSATVGYALIHGISVAKFNQELENERQTFLRAQSGLTTEIISGYPEIQSYRRMYRQMGIDWHSKRPSPEALLRRLATGKGLYPPINTCVDAYNLIVMQNRISVGAFDADKIHFPVEVKLAAGGEQAYFIGDQTTPTTLNTYEVCYFDQQGPYNLDYNYRDALRTVVTEKTKNIWINTEGVFDITPEQILETLANTISIITKYCGGKVIEQGCLVAKE